MSSLVTCNYKLFKQMIFLLLFTGLSGQTVYAQHKTLQQDKNSLLGGFTNGVAYSGFRHGQHPDRGSGAVNPTDAEILEDLKILTRDLNFGLIRLYDSQENSESVLKIIRANDL